MNKKVFFVHIFLIAALGFAAYLPARHGAFIWDDNLLVKDNADIRNWSNAPRIFTNHLAGDAFKQYGTYRPVVSLVYMVDYFFWKLNPLGYHLTNIALHFLVTFCLYWFLCILFGNATPLAFLTCVFFVVHPVHAEAVAYISGRNDLLALLFMFLTFIVYIKRQEAKRPWFFLLLILNFCLALLSKEGALILPALILFYHYAFRKKLRRGDLVVLAGISLLYVFLRLTLFKGAQLKTYAAETVFERLPGVFEAILNYCRLLILPFDLHLDYGKRLFHFSDAGVLLGMLFVLVLSLFAFKKRKTDPLLFFSIGWFFLALLPVSNIYPLPFYMAEHWLYVPSVGFFIILARGVLTAWQRKKSRIFAGVTCVALVSFWFGVTIHQVGYWLDPVYFYKRTISFNPMNPALYDNLGQVYEDRGDTARAGASYKKAMSLDPYYARAYRNLGLLYDKLGRCDEAIALYKQAITISPDYADLYNNLGTMYARLDARQDAIVLLKKAIELRPNYAFAYYNLGNVYFDMARYDEAAAAYQKAVRLNPSYGKAYGNLAIICLYKKEYSQAVRYEAVAVRNGSFNPELSEALKPYNRRS